MKKKHEATLANAPLNTEEKRDFKRLDGVVKKACDAQWEMAAALNEIRERKLYRADHPTFEAYCKKQHAFTRTRAYQLTDAAEVRKQIENVYHGRQIPTSERQCRELVVVPENKLPEVWSQIVEHSESEGKQITAKMIKEHTEPFRESADGASPEFDEAKAAERITGWLRATVKQWPEDRHDVLADSIRCALDEELRLSP
ncbi:MAG: hypothetical protein MK364_02170 [Pirellulales bacterium]|nr:hypothetical protein [Pirellulales bacterium]